MACSFEFLFVCISKQPKTLFTDCNMLIHGVFTFLKIPPPFPASMTLATFANSWQRLGLWQSIHRVFQEDPLSSA